MLHRNTLALAVSLAWASSTLAQENKAAVTLPEVQVTATSDAASEWSRSYAAKAVTVGSKIAQTVRETPFSISVITRQRLDDQNVTKIEDILKQTTGISVTRLDGAGNFNTLQARGFDIGSIQLDGLAISQGANYSTGMDTALYDRIEVLRGPAGLLQGAGEPGGTINLVRKRAGADFAGSASGMLGSWDKKRAEIDLQGKLIESGRIRARVVGVVDRRASYVDVLKSDKDVAYGTVEFDLSPSTTLSLGAAHQKIDSTIDQGLPPYASGALLDIPLSTYIGRDANLQDMKTDDKFAELEHRFDNGGLVKLALRQVDRWMLYSGARANSAASAAGNVALQTVAYKQEMQNQNADLYLTTPFELGGRKHRLLIGANYSTEDSKSVSVFGPSGTFNVFKPDYSVALPPLLLGPYNSSVGQTQSGVYGQLQLKPFERWTFLLGGRLSWWDTVSGNPLTGAVLSKATAERHFTPLTSAILELNQQASLYASYGETFVPQKVLDAAGKLLEPRSGSQIEFGLKAELFDKQVNTHVALFRILDKNRALDDPTTANRYVAGGEVRSQGLEAEISGQVRPGWDLTAGYAYTATRYMKAAAIQQGQAFSTATPKHSVNLWSKHSFQDGELKRWSVAGGLRSVSEFYAQSGAVRVTGKPFTVLNGQIGYQLAKATTASLTVNNLLDKKYYEKVNVFSRQNFYGEPRNVTLSLKTLF